MNLKEIEIHWREVLRLVTSIKQRTVTASLMLKKLASYPKQNGLAKALREIGRIERTLFMLDWFRDPDPRRRVQAGLNKGEARNALARAVFMYRPGEIRDRKPENQSYRASGLRLLTTAISLWNKDLKKILCMLYNFPTLFIGSSRFIKAHLVYTTRLPHIL
jgi:TnpA family transposase